MKFLLFFLVCLPIRALCINAGGPAINPCVADAAYAHGGILWNQPDMGPGSLTTLRYGPEFSYDIPIEPGNYVVSLTFVEPNQSAAGKRVFTVKVNDQESGLIDVFGDLARFGGCPAFTCATSPGSARKAYTLRFLTIVTNGDAWVHLNFQGLIGNAIINQITIEPISPFKTIPWEWLPFQLGTGLSFDTSTNPATLNIQAGPILTPVLDGTTYRPQVFGERAQRITANLFQIQHKPSGESIRVYLDGIRKDFAFDYVLREEGLQIEFGTPVPEASRVLVDYFYDARFTKTIQVGQPPCDAVTIQLSCCMSCTAVDVQ
jgi:hypothetical protein